MKAWRDFQQSTTAGGNFKATGKAHHSMQGKWGHSLYDRRPDARLCHGTLRLHSCLWNITAQPLVPSYTALWQRHMAWAVFWGPCSTAQWMTLEPATSLSLVPRSTTWLPSPAIQVLVRKNMTSYCFCVSAKELQTCCNEDLVKVFYNGSCVWARQYQQSVTHCPMNIQWFPFDRQVCTIVFESKHRDSKELHVSPIVPYFVQQRYIINGEWTLLGKPLLVVTY